MTHVTAQLDAIRTFERLRDAYLRYYDTPFGLADEKLQSERRDLLDRDGGIYREPLLELRPEYQSAGRSIAESANIAQADPDLAEFVSLGLLRDIPSLYQHQEDALQRGLERGQHVAITAGTGSGKTEAFLLPILSTLLAESRTWTGHGSAPTDWWSGANRPFRSQRNGENGRDAAVRAMILYPMNALVDDQLIRLRRALDNDAVRTWMDQNRAGHRFYFGRYTGATPVTGGRQDSLSVRELRQYLQNTHKRSERALHLANERSDDNLRYFVPRLDGAEMRSRWDMLDYPPDILITNYSMLNVMLLRDRDSGFFDSTRRWLDDSRNVFSLVVDELHTYRGTAGTEVAYLIRTLKRRLGLEERSEQFRVIAASASLDSKRDAEYFRQFFDVSCENLHFVLGSSVEPSHREPRSAQATARLVAAEPATAAEEARHSGVVDILRNVLRRNGHGGARTLPQIAREVFPEAPLDEAKSAIRNVLAGLAQDPKPDDPKLRAHLFFRNVPGIWACCNPSCTAVSPAQEGRTVGKLYAQPASRCECGARVLELLYCQSCGDVMLGGFAPEGEPQKRAVRTPILADTPDLAKLPDQVTVQRTANNYVVYWPRPQQSLPNVDSESWTRDKKALSYSFRKSRLVPISGELRNMTDGFTGWSFHAEIQKDRRTGEPRRSPQTVSPFPTKCPNCGDDWEIRFDSQGRHLPATDPATQRSPIRTMRTGFERINQVLTSELANDLPLKDRKLIAFTDSRQDAAKLSAGINLRHYQDILRQFFYKRLTCSDGTIKDLRLLEDHFVGGMQTAESFAAIDHLTEQSPREVLKLIQVFQNKPGTGAADAERLKHVIAEPPTISTLAIDVASDLLSLGINPGGPKAHLQRTAGDFSVPWSQLYDWTTTPPTLRHSLSDPQRGLLSEMHQSLEVELLEGLFSGGGRDFEALGLGWLTLASDTSPAHCPRDSAIGEVRSALRILADQRRFFHLRPGRDEPTPRLGIFWRSVAAARGCDPDSFCEQVLARANGAIKNFLIDPSKVVLRRSEGHAWVCTKCGRKHLTTGNGHCAKCAALLPEHPIQVDLAHDYYAWKASRNDGGFRFNCAELTGQTDRIDAQSRQSRFQNVFLEDSENELADGVDLLSVTTTMEAGVDIGALSAVVLGNMPPTRFNYQQRVGRAGRRSAPIAIALTVCRGRSHDEYYFERPERITNEPTPKPYLVLDQPEIFSRSFRSEVLRQASSSIFPRDDLLDAGTNVHGAFGKTADWHTEIRSRLERWLVAHPDSVFDTARSLAHGTSLQGEAEHESERCIGTLLKDIDIAVSVGHHEDLSQLLSEQGLLPMFGFPTSVRYLYLNRPRSSYPWPPSGAIDRDLAMAVSQFAPMNEVVRDGRIYPVVGIAAFRPSGPQPTPETDPLGVESLLTICRACSYLGKEDSEHSSTNLCPRCGAGPGFYTSVPLRQPLGFRSGPSSDFDGNFAWRPRAMAARAMTDISKLSSQEAGDALVLSGPGTRYVINDNAGRLFELKRASQGPPNWGGYVSTSAIESGLVSSSSGTGEPFQVALGATQHTDFLFVGAKSPIDRRLGLRLNLVSNMRQPYGSKDIADSRRAAWYSLAFLLRTVACTVLDIQPLELIAGIYSGMSDAEPATYAFLADTLENGAGFSTKLGSEEFLPDYLQAVDSFLYELESPDHSEVCDSSCYRCLRDYGNMAYHPLLDWRLARDLFRFLHGTHLAPDVAADAESVASWARAYGATPIESVIPAVRYESPSDGSFAIVTKHAFEASEGDLMAPRLTQVMNNTIAMEEGLDGIVFVDSFTLNHAPRRVLEMISHSRPAGA